jgi:hypothetical protein
MTPKGERMRAEGKVRARPRLRLQMKRAQCFTTAIKIFASRSKEVCRLESFQSHFIHITAQSQQSTQHTDMRSV